MNNKLFVGGISYKTSESNLADFFSVVPGLVSAKIVTDRETKRSRGFGFAEFETEDQARKAVEELDKKELDGRTIFLSFARPKND